MNKTQEKAGCLTVILRLFGIDLAKAKSSRELPYRKRDDFLSAAERSFLGVLQVALGTRAVLMAKVRVADLLYVPRGEGWLSWQNKIDRKHVDFVLCDPNTFQPLAAIELDDASHDRPDRRDRDQFLDEAFAAAKLPLVHFPARRQYDPRLLAAELEPYIKQQAIPRTINSGPPTPAVANSNNSPIVCPKCGATMVIHVASKGPRQGQQFHACPNYPQCKSTLAIEPT